MIKPDEILAATTWRRAIKKFTSRKISDENWQFLLNVARLAPSSFGFEPWQILDINSRELRAKIKPALENNSAKLDADHFIIFTVVNDLAPTSKYFREIMKNHGMNLALRTGYLAAFAMFSRDQNLSTPRERHDWAAKQAYIAFAQMIFAAAAIGIDSCPVEGFAKTKLEKILAENHVINLDKESVALCAAFGYRDGDPDFAKTRRELSEIVKEIN